MDGDHGGLCFEHVKEAVRNQANSLAESQIDELLRNVERSESERRECERLRAEEEEAKRRREEQRRAEEEETKRRTEEQRRAERHSAAEYRQREARNAQQARDAEECRRRREEQEAEDRLDNARRQSEEREAEERRRQREADERRREREAEERRRQHQEREAADAEERRRREAVRSEAFRRLRQTPPEVRAERFRRYNDLHRGQPHASYHDGFYDQRFPREGHRRDRTRHGDSGYVTTAMRQLERQRQEARDTEKADFIDWALGELHMRHSSALSDLDRLRGNYGSRSDFQAAKDGLNLTHAAEERELKKDLNMAFACGEMDDYLDEMAGPAIDRRDEHHAYTSSEESYR
ncbi:hypothetical protein ACHAQH_005946 [Verticillium albo-atrum]